MPPSPTMDFSDPDEEDDVPVSPAPVSPAPNLLERRKKIRAMTDAAALASHRKANPFATSFDPPPPVSERTYAEAEREVAGVEQDYAASQRATNTAIRRQTVEQGRQQVAERNAYNSRALADFKKTGRKHYTDPATKRLVGEVDEKGRPVHELGPWEIGKDEKGVPFKSRRGVYGEPEVQRGVIKASDDPLDDFLHADLGDMGSSPWRTIDEGLKDPDVSVRKTAQTAFKARDKAQWDSALTEVSGRLEVASQAKQTKESEVAILQKRLETSQRMASNFTTLGAQDPNSLAMAEQANAEVAQLAKQIYAAKEELKPGGPLDQNFQIAQAEKTFWDAKRKHAAYVKLDEELKQKLESGEIDPAKAVGTQAVVQEALQKWEVGAQQAFGNLQKVQERGTIVNAGRAFVRGAAAEGVGGTLEGIARGVSSPVMKAGLAGAESAGDPEMAGMIASAQGLSQMGETLAPGIRNLREMIRRAIPIDEKFRESLTGKIAEGAGQFAGTLPAALAGPGGMAVASMGQIYQEGFDDAMASGASEDAAHAAALKYLPAASLDFIGDRLVVGRLLKPLIGKATVGQIMKAVGTAFAAEGITEGLQQGMLNYVARGSYDENRAFTKDVWDSMIVGAVVGGGVSAGGHAVRAAITPEQSGGPAPEATPAPPTTPLAPAGGENVTVNPDGSATVKTASGSTTISGANAEQIAKDLAAANAPGNQSTPLGDQPVKIEMRHSRTGETIEVEVGARKAEERVLKHQNVLRSLIDCLGGRT